MEIFPKKANKHLSVETSWLIACSSSNTQALNSKLMITLKLYQKTWSFWETLIKKRNLKRLYRNFYSSRSYSERLVWWTTRSGSLIYLDKEHFFVIQILQTKQILSMFINSIIVMVIPMEMSTQTLLALLINELVYLFFVVEELL